MPTSNPDTPLMRQYLEIKGKYPDAILFFRLGDFYEMFFDDAEVAARALDLTLTSRDKNADNPVPMCGVPHHAASGYLKRLIEQGHKVAICEQMEDPKAARGIVKRAVTRVITPGVVLETDHLEAKQNNYLAAIAARGQHYGLAALDLSTFEVQVSDVRGASALVDELARLSPKEVVFDARASETLAPVQRAAPGAWQPAREGLFGTAAENRAMVENQTTATTETLTEMLGEAQGKPTLALAAVSAALRYAADTQPETQIPRCRLSARRLEQHLLLDEATLRNLEVFESNQARVAADGRGSSLLRVVDYTLTPMGGRLLRRTIAAPLRDVAAIRRRHDGVQLLLERRELCERLRGHLQRMHDLERLTSRAVLRIASPHDLHRLGGSLAELPRIAACLAEARACRLGGELPELLRWPKDTLQEVATDISDCLTEEPPTGKNASIVRRGFDARLDELIELCEGGRSRILAIEQRERKRTGIPSLKVRFNKVFGYFIEVTKANLRLVPDDFTRKQTLANAERFVTEELAEHEAKVLSAEERRKALEQQLFDQLRDRVAAQGARLAAAAERVAQLDLLCGFAELAARHDYVRPVIEDSAAVVEIIEGRHPVVERCMGSREFVPNDVRIDQHNRLLVITGPNMAGKSTVMRQVALITILAQAGAFVPCRSCRIGLVDRIFTRVGASDNLSRGDSTFMVEMRETATIVQEATERSLIVLDEIGRGTATYDGISIAWAVAEYLHDRVAARTLFATHYHELCALAEVKDRVANMTMATQEWKGEVVFLRKLVEGAASRSYGIEVARLAGVDRVVLARARQILGALESGVEVEGLPLAGRTRSPQLGLFERQPAPRSISPLERALRQIDIDRLTPLEALNTLAKLVDQANADSREN